MGFQHSAQDVRVDDGHILRARLQRGDGEWNDAEIDLDNFVGNVDGHFVWEGQGFSQSSTDIQFNIEADGDAAVLRASLSDAEGNYEARDINLSERIQNYDGNFHFE